MLVVGCFELDLGGMRLAQKGSTLMRLYRLLVLSLVVMASVTALAQSPVIVAQVSLFSESQSIAPTTLFTPSNSGVYRISAYMFTKNAVNSGYWSLHLKWVDDDNSRETPKFWVQVTSKPRYSQGSEIVRAVAGQPISYFTSQEGSPISLTTCSSQSSNWRATKPAQRGEPNPKLIGDRAPGRAFARREAVLSTFEMRQSSCGVRDFLLCAIPVLGFYCNERRYRTCGFSVRPPHKNRVAGIAIDLRGIVADGFLHVCSPKSPQDIFNHLQPKESSVLGRLKTMKQKS